MLLSVRYTLNTAKYGPIHVKQNFAYVSSDESDSLKKLLVMIRSRKAVFFLGFENEQ